MVYIFLVLILLVLFPVRFGIIKKSVSLESLPDDELKVLARRRPRLVWCYLVSKASRLLITDAAEITGWWEQGALGLVYKQDLEVLVRHLEVVSFGCREILKKSRGGYGIYFWLGKKDFLNAYTSYRLGSVIKSVTNSIAVLNLGKLLYENARQVPKEGLDSRLVKYLGLPITRENISLMMQDVQGTILLPIFPEVQIDDFSWYQKWFS